MRYMDYLGNIALTW